MSVHPSCLRALSVVATALAASACSGDALSPNRPLAPTGSAAALLSTTVEVVTPSEVHDGVEGATYPGESWVKRTRNAGSGTLVAGPGAPPLGVGSFQVQTPTSSDKVWLLNYDHTGSALGTIGAIGYATYRTAGTAAQVPALNMEIDANGAADGGYAVLVFEPVYNTAQGTVTDGTWQTWDAYAGGGARWWSSRPIGGVCAFSCYASWSQIVANNPDAVLLSYGVNAGSGNPALDAAADALSLGFSGGTSVVYDLEPYRVATSEAQCKDGGWQRVRRADGTAFPNQGRCIEYVRTGR